MRSACLNLTLEGDPQLAEKTVEDPVIAKTYREN
jgi:hypothetical protein